MKPTPGPAHASPDAFLANLKLAGDGRAAAAAFDLTPLPADRRRNRAQRLELPAVFAGHPVPSLMGPCVACLAARAAVLRIAWEAD